MGRSYENYIGTRLTGSINISKPYPLDVKTVVENLSDLTDGKLLNSSYEGLVVYVNEDKSIYVCYNKPSDNKLKNLEDGWKKVDVDYSVRIVESESDLTDGTTIMFPYQGLMAYVTSESALYILLTKGVDKAKDINNWRKISTSSTSGVIDKIGIDVAPEGGSGFKITKNDLVVDEYSPEVYAYYKDVDVRVLTEYDLNQIDDKIDNLAYSIMIDLDGESSDDNGSDNLDPIPLQEVIVNMNNSINNLEQTKSNPETIEHSEISQLFS